MNYGEKIARLRKSKCMTQEELGKILNVTYQAVSKWERGESLPDFDTMSQIAKFFQVPLSYFEDGGEKLQGNMEAATASAVNNNLIGMCTECGKMLKEEDVFTASPKIICKNCAERQKQASIIKMNAEAASEKRAREEAARIQRGGGIDAKLIVSLILAVAGYILFTVLVFTSNPYDRDLLGALLFIVPLALFACTHAVFDLIDDLRDKDGPEGYTRNISFIIGAAFSVINFALFLTMYLSFEKQVFYMGMLVISVILSFTFVSQFMWGNVVKDIFTCGGFTFKLPGVIFSLTAESILWMIIIKVVLGIIAIGVFVLTTIFFALVAIFGSFFTFIPAVIFKTVKDKKV